MTDYKDSDFFDEDGNLIATAWELEERKEQRERERIAEEERRKKALREANRVAAIDHLKSRSEQEIDRNRKARSIRNQWSTMPQWIKDMPHTPLSDPPTEGGVEKILTSITKKTRLTDSEMKRRKADLYRLKVSIQDYNDIHREFEGTGRESTSATVISVGRGVGGTMISRGISKALGESRKDIGPVTSLDFGRPDNSFSRWYNGETSVKEMVTMRNLVAILRNTRDRLSPSEVLPIAGMREYFLSNRSEEQWRVETGLDEVLDISDFVKEDEGITIFDCDDHDSETLETCLSLCSTTVFVVEPTRESFDQMESLIGRLRNELDFMDEIIENSIIVVNGKTPNTATKENFDRLIALTKVASQRAGVDEHRCVVLAYDREMSNPPMDWDNVKFGTKHTFRVIAGMIVGDAISEG